MQSILWACMNIVKKKTEIHTSKVSCFFFCWGFLFMDHRKAGCMAIIGVKRGADVIPVGLFHVFWDIGASCLHNVRPDWAVTDLLRWVNTNMSLQMAPEATFPWKLHRVISKKKWCIFHGSWLIFSLLPQHFGGNGCTSACYLTQSKSNIGPTRNSLKCQRLGWALRLGFTTSSVGETRAPPRMGLEFPSNPIQTLHATVCQAERKTRVHATRHGFARARKYMISSEIKAVKKPRTASPNFLRSQQDAGKCCCCYRTKGDLSFSPLHRNTTEVLQML